MGWWTADLFDDRPAPRAEASGVGHARPSVNVRWNDIPPNPVTRFAPSVTGYLHLGHVAHALYVWGIAGASGARVRARLEDHDRQRYRPAYEDAMHEDLAWLGFAADDPPPWERQSDHASAFEDAHARIAVQGEVYGCACTRREVAAAAGHPDDEPQYAGTCRGRGLMGDGLAMRVVTPPGNERALDVAAGWLDQDPAAQCGDIVLRDRAGQWSYHLAVVVDDARQGVNLIIRGRDLLTSTGRQLRLARMLGITDLPTYCHHPLVRDDRGRKLSKRDGALGLRQLRREGRAPEEVLGMAAHAVGLQATAAPLAAENAATLFR